MLDFSLEGRLCSFCGSASRVPDEMVSGYGALICKDCVDDYHRAKAPTALAGEAPVDPWAASTSQDLLANLELIVSTKRQVDDFLQAYVDMLRERRLSWASIGGALGVSRQAAWERFSRPRAL